LEQLDGTGFNSNLMAGLQDLVEDLPKKGHGKVHPVKIVHKIKKEKKKAAKKITTQSLAGPEHHKDLKQKGYWDVGGNIVKVATNFTSKLRQLLTTKRFAWETTENK
jgi:hypothetical protein